MRFLPEYDNVLLSHDDRSRFFSGPARGAARAARGLGWGSVLGDGIVSGAWRLEPDRLVVRHVDGLPKKTLAAISAEGRRLARFLEADARDVRLLPLSP